MAFLRLGKGVVDMGADGAKAPGRRQRSRRGAGGLALAALLAGLAVAAAGCGGGGPGNGVANLGGTTTAQGGTTTSPAADASPSGALSSSAGSGSGSQNHFAMTGQSAAKMMALAACMRTHGVPNFPDPNSQGVVSGTGLNPDSPQFQHAISACQKLGLTPPPPSPAQVQQMQRQALAYSACMRSHGVPNYPDPTFGSGGRVSMKIGGPGSGLDPNSPEFQAAQKACQKDQPGFGKGGAGPVVRGQG